MNSMFSSFDALCAEVLGQTVKASFPFSQQQKSSGFFNSLNKKQDSKPEAGQVKKQDQQKTAPPQPRRFAVELDGLHCFETIV
ncbi:hypothetical protein ACLB2K_046603 [Fragaria x ananassa]